MNTSRTSRIQFVFICLCLLFCSTAYGQVDEESRSWNQPVKPYRVISNVYYVGATEVSSFLIVTPRGHILLDSGFQETVPQIQKNVVELGFRFEDIKILINSHAHYDHAGGLALLKQLTKATLIATRADAELMARGGKGDPNFGDRFAFQPVTVDKFLKDGDKVELGGVVLIAHLTPGHTKGCTTWTMKVKEGAKQYDVVIVGSASAPGYKLIDNQQYPTIVKDYERTFRVLKSLKCDVFLAPHGSFYSMLQKAKLLEEGAKQNPFIDPNGYRDYVERTEKAFREQLQRQSTAKWQLVWADEFDYDGLPDPKRWGYDVGGHGWGNKELQYYTERRKENARVENGRLIIEARRDAWEGHEYTSARLVSKGKGDWTYGRFEVRAKLPSGRGTWPAIWMLPSGKDYGGWPNGGEIDIMEHVGFDPDVVHGSVHTKSYHHSIKTQKSAKVSVPNSRTEFNTYAVEWTRDEIRAFVNDRHFFTFKNERLTNSAADYKEWPFDKPFHLLLNIAVGGTWGGTDGVDQTIWPQRMEIDYVRVYQATK